MVNWEFEKRSLYVFSLSDLPIKLIIFSMIGVLAVGAIAGRLTILLFWLRYYKIQKFLAIVMKLP
ncbi:MULTISPECIES: hypothetical protein [unclassified Nostoc]|uniref:hypothetical protein n=1 Tax=unclassified Nostoc TaxID=2593658 RepID=UPI002619FCF9|nr:hypothetical protein [Nostoc sp. S13]MDF5735736.1 hypothetical protein [Nostoc sp. S13]